MLKITQELLTRIKRGGEEFQIGKPLPWTFFDSEGRLLRRKGAVLDTQEQLTQLAELAEFYLDASSGRPLPVEDNIKPPFFVIGEMMGRLDKLLEAIATGQTQTAVSQLDALCTDIQVSCATDADAALAALHLDRDGKYVIRHLIHTALLVELVSYRLGYLPNDRHRVIAAALTSNVGMLHLQEQLQQQDSVSGEQRQEIKAHPERSAQLLWQAGVRDKLWLEMVLQHHERMDGSGYPQGLLGNEIFEGARIIALADIYHAMISSRAYRQAMIPTSALRQVFLGQGKDVDQQMAAVFIKELGVYPPGAFVLLVNGDVAVVTHRGLDSISPKVASVITPRGTPYPRPVPRETGNREYGIKEVILRDETVLLTDLLPLWGY